MTQCHLNRQPQRSVRNNRVKYSAYGKSSECSVLHHSVLIPHSAISVVATMAASKLTPRLKANNTGTGYVQAAQLHNNPVALLPPHLQKNLDLEVVVMSDILPDDTPIQIPRHPPPPPKKPIQAISLWVEKYSTQQFFSPRVSQKRKLFSYLASVFTERKFDQNRWVAYDRCYHREALANKCLDWSLPNMRWYNEVCHARTIPRCTHCLQEDHASFHALTTKLVHGSPGCLTHSLPHPHPTQPGHHKRGAHQVQ